MKLPFLTDKTKKKHEKYEHPNQIKTANFEYIFNHSTGLQLMPCPCEFKLLSSSTNISDIEQRQIHV